MARRPRQLALHFATWGGRRPGAGRKPAPGRRSVAHRPRPIHDACCPAHVTLRAVPELPSLRGDALFAALRTALTRASTATFRVLEFSVQADHLHLLVEADGSRALSRGLQGFAVRAAKAVNRTLRRRGTVWADRFRARALRTPREVRNAIVYVLNNFKKHMPGARGLDPRSSAPWFAGWRIRMRPPPGAAPVVAPRTWLARVGWLRGGRLDPDERPRVARRR